MVDSGPVFPSITSSEHSQNLPKLPDIEDEDEEEMHSPRIGGMRVLSQPPPFGVDLPENLDFSQLHQ